MNNPYSLLGLGPQPATAMAQNMLGYEVPQPVGMMANDPRMQLNVAMPDFSQMQQPPQEPRGLLQSMLTGPGSSERLSALGASLLSGPSQTPISLGSSFARGLASGNQAATQAIREAEAQRIARINAENERALRLAKEARDTAKAEREASKEQREQTKFDIEMKESEVKSAEKTEQEVKKEAEKKFNALSSLDSISQAENILNESPFLSSGLIGQMTKDIEASPAGQLDSLYDSIRAKLGFDQLQTMRENSPTGGALGQVSDTENKLLQSTIAALKTGLPKDQQLKNLEKIKQHTAAIVYGAVDKDGNVVKLDTQEKVYKLMNGELKVNIPSQATSVKVITREELLK